MCPVLDTSAKDISIEGEFTDDIQAFVEAKVKIREDVVRNITKLEKLKKLMNENPLLVMLYIVNSQVNAEEYSNFLGNYLVVLNSFVSLNSVKYYEVSFSKINFSTDNNILWQSPNENTAVTFSKSDYNSFNVDDRDKINIDDKLTLITFYLKSSSKAYVYERTYQKLNDFLADMLGLLSHIVLIIFVVMGYLNEKSARQKIIRKITK